MVEITYGLYFLTWYLDLFPYIGMILGWATAIYTLIYKWHEDKARRKKESEESKRKEFFEDEGYFEILYKAVKIENGGLKEQVKTMNALARKFQQLILTEHTKERREQLNKIMEEFSQNLEEEYKGLADRKT